MNAVDFVTSASASDWITVALVVLVGVACYLVFRRLCS